MAVITYETYDLDSMEYNLNLCKDAVVAMLAEHGHLTKEQAEEYMRDYHIMVKLPSRFAKWWKKIFPDEDTKHLIIVKNMTMRVPDEKS